MGFVSKIFSPKVSVPKQETPAQPAQPAADVSAPTSNQESAVDSSGESLKRKAKGKRGLMISSASNSTGGGTSGGTGLNI